MTPDNTTATLWLKITYISMEVIIGLCAVVGNMLVIWVVKLNPSLRTTTFYFIVSLALADIAVGILVMPLAIAVSLEVRMHFYTCLFMACVILIFTQASIMSLLAIAVDRYLRVKLTVSFIIWILIPLLVMCVIYLDIFCILRKKLSQNLSGFRETRAFYGREFKTAKSLFLVLFLFALCWLPLSIINFVSYFKVNIPEVARFLGILLSHANSMMNPIV
ncbi:Adenosine receptor A3 [Microtus ochrogaster]|uniref:Adenosine receptor A3 n=1 Tax=Microtus ochrogaster TaxID=79684 RepID=A0A8J6GHD9_MICOH|nr:Adenosine receptor A3 [Microtus ochrogaster]